MSSCESAEAFAAASDPYLLLLLLQPPPTRAGRAGRLFGRARHMPAGPEPVGVSAVTCRLRRRLTAPSACLHNSAPVILVVAAAIGCALARPEDRLIDLGSGVAD